MADIQKKFLCPRLVDYLAIVGARPTSPKNANSASPAVQVSLSDYLRLTFSDSINKIT